MMRALSLLLGLTALSTTLAACGDGDDGSSDAGDAGDAGADTDSDADSDSDADAGPTELGPEVPQGDAGVYWLPCMVGQTWADAGCEGDPSIHKWDEAQEVCPNGYHPPSRDHYVVLLGSCEPQIQEGDEAGNCSSCADSETCDGIFPDAAEATGMFWDVLWTETSIDDSTAWLANLKTGRVKHQPKSSSGTVLCVRGD